MGTIAGNLSIKKISEAEPGELVLLDHENERVLGFRLQDPRGGFSDDPVRVAVIESISDQGIRFITVRREEYCASYGTSWVIEPVNDPRSTRPYTGNIGDPGTLFIGTEGMATLRVVQTHSGGDISLSDMGLGAVQSEAVAFARWRIWASEEDYRSPKGAYLVEIVARPPEPR